MTWISFAQGLAINVFLLLGFAALLAMVRYRNVKHRHSVVWLDGALFGILAVVAMTIPVVTGSGVQFDCRGGVIGSAALLGGPVCALISLPLPLLYRLHIGGAGTIPGLMEILLPALLGSFFHMLGRLSLRLPTVRDAVVYSLLVGLCTNALIAATVFLFTPNRELVPGIGSFMMIVLFNGPVSMALLSILLILARQRLDNALLQASVLQTAMDGYWLVDLRGGLRDVNEAYCRMSGYSREELLAKRIADLEARMSAQQIEDRMTDIVSKRGQRFETCHRRKDGSTFDVDVSVQYLSVDDGRVVCFLRDITGRKQAEAKLQASEDRFRDFFAMASEGVMIYDKGAMLDANQAFVEMAGGTTVDELVGRNGLEAISFAPESRQRVQDAMNAEFTGYFDVDIVNCDGSMRHCETRARTISYRGRPARLVLMRDITQRRQAEAATKLNEERLEALMALNNMTGASERDLSHFAMEAAVRLTGSTIGYLAFMNEDETVLTMYAWSRHAMGECAIIDKPIVYPVASTGLWGEAVRQRMPIITNDYAAPSRFKKGVPEGHVHITRHMNAPIFDDDRIVIVAGVGNKATDYDDNDVRQLSLLMSGLWSIIQRKRAEDALRLFKESVEYASDAVGMATPDGKHYYQNKAFDELFGEVGKDPSAVYVDPAVGREVFQTIMAGGQWTGEVKMYGRGRRVLDILLRAYANKDKDGRITALVGMHTDITDQRKLEQNLRQAAKMDAVGRLAGGVAHDFNNMLGGILGYAELAMERCAPGDPIRADLKQIEQAAQRSADLTRQLLAFARKQTVAPKVLDLNVTVEGMLKLLRRLIGEDIELAWKPSRERVMIKMDPAQLDQILANLCVNARDAIAAGGVITIETTRVTFDEEDGEQTYIAPGEYVLLVVRDNGCGMDAETVTHIFEPFFTTKGQGKGTGLGLATVYGVVKQNNGHINVNSEPGKGTAFNIYLPRQAEQGAPVAVATVPEEPVRGDEVVLLVEDEPTMLEITTVMLRKLGYQVLVARSPAEALALVKQRADPIDLLVTDVVMPGMNGRELGDRLTLLRPELKRLYMSGYTADVIANHGVLDEGVRFIQKPFSIKVLAGKLREALGG